MASQKLKAEAGVVDHIENSADDVESSKPEVVAPIPGSQDPNNPKVRLVSCTVLSRTAADQHYRIGQTARSTGHSVQSASSASWLRSTPASL